MGTLITKWDFEFLGVFAFRLISPFAAAKTFMFIDCKTED